jgi:hypothetical protein
MNAAARNRAREIAALLRVQPRGYHQGALIAGAKSFSANDRHHFIAKRRTLRAELFALYDTGS